MAQTPMTPDEEIRRLHAFTLRLAGHLADASEVLGYLAEKGRRRMNELSKSLNKASEYYDPESDHAPEYLRNKTPESIAMQESAEKWAVASLRTFKDGLLTKALAISQAISQFVEEIERP